MADISNASAPITGSYLDFSGLSRLKGQAQQDDQAALKETAQQFEALFTQMMLKSMRNASMKSDMVDTKNIDTFQDMHDKELSVQLAKHGGLGITQMLVRQLSHQVGPAKSADTVASPEALNHSQNPSGLPLTPPRPEIALEKLPQWNPLRSKKNDGFPIKSSVNANAAASAYAAVAAPLASTVTIKE